MSYSPGACVFGYFDGDAEFALDADRHVEFARRKLGDPVMTVHMSSSQIYASFEEACLELSATTNAYQAKSVLSQFLGAATGSLSGSENTYPSRTIEMQKRLAEPYGEEAGVGGTHQVFSGSIMTFTGQQKYNLQALLSGSGPLTGSNANARIYPKDIFHFSPLGAYRFFGTTSAINYLHNQFNFESFTPETIFYLLPIWEDVLRGMQFKMSNKVRRSNYSYNIRDNELILYPAPTQDMPLFLTYTLAPDPTSPSNPYESAAFHGVSNLSNVPFGVIQYSKLNSISKNWIRRMTFALSKEIEGHIRSKLASIPIPSGDLVLDGRELISDARVEMDALRLELKEMLEETTYQKLIEQEAMMSENINRAIKDAPLPIYVGAFLPFMLPLLQMLRL